MQGAVPTKNATSTVRPYPLNIGGRQFHTPNLGVAPKKHCKTRGFGHSTPKFRSEMAPLNLGVCHKIPRLGWGGILVFFGGGVGKCRFYFMGAGIFLRLAEIGAPTLGSAEGGHPDLFRLVPISLFSSDLFRFALLAFGNLFPFVPICSPQCFYSTEKGSMENFNP